MTIEMDLRDLFDEPTACAPIDVGAVLMDAHRQRRARRRRRVAVVGVTIALATAFTALRPGRGPDRSDALTLTPASSPAVIRTSEGHVRFSDGLEVWRSGSELFIGHQDVSRGGYAGVDTHNRQGSGGRDSLGTFNDEGIVTSVVHDVPRAVSVTLSGETRSAEIACFTQTPGWCVWAASFGRPLTHGETLSLSADPAGHIRFTD
jgi:hypothetical protein